MQRGHGGDGLFPLTQIGNADDRPADGEGDAIGKEDRENDHAEQAPTREAGGQCGKKRQLFKVRLEQLAAEESKEIRGCKQQQNGKQYEADGLQNSAQAETAAQLCFGLQQIAPCRLSLRRAERLFFSGHADAPL